MNDFDWIEDIKVIDLRTCKYGDILISQHGAKLKYIKPLSEEDYMDHEVEYDDILGRASHGVSSRGTRTHDGYVYRKRRLPTDHDIIEIIHI